MPFDETRFLASLKRTRRTPPYPAAAVFIKYFLPDFQVVVVVVVW